MADDRFSILSPFFYYGAPVFYLRCTELELIFNRVFPRNHCVTHSSMASTETGYGTTGLEISSCPEISPSFTQFIDDLIE